MWIRRGPNPDHKCDEPPEVRRNDNGFTIEVTSGRTLNSGAIWACNQLCQTGLTCPEMWLFLGFDDDSPVWKRTDYFGGW